jgi:hypothetical protein
VLFDFIAGIRHRHAILKSLSDSEKNHYPSPDSLYKQHVHLMAGVKNADENKLRLGKYQKRLVVQLAKTVSDSNLEASKIAYLEKNSAAIAKAKAKAQKRGDDFDIDDPTYHMIIWGDLDFSDFNFPDFDFPDFDFPDIDLNF